MMMMMVRPPAKEALATEPEPKKCYGNHVLHKVLEPDASKILGLMRELTGTEKFPGPNPISLERKDTVKLGRQRYYACEKTDGVRHAFFACTYKGNNVAVIIDRRLSVWLLPLRGLPRAAFQGTILDGEVAFNMRGVPAEPDAGFWQYLTFDAVWVSGIPVFSLPFMDRVNAVRTMLSKYREDGDDMMRMRVKEFVDMSVPGGRQRLEAHMDLAATFFKCDGMIFTPDMPVQFGRHMEMFKFKDAEKNTVDFVVSSGGQLGVYDQQSRSHTVVGRLLSSDAARVRLGAIVECSLRCARSKTWNLVMERTDKSTANDTYTFSKTLLNIKENLLWKNDLAPLFP